MFHNKELHETQAIIKVNEKGIYCCSSLHSYRQISNDKNISNVVQSGVPVNCETKRETKYTETKRNETKFTETKRNLPKWNEMDAKRNKSKRNETI